MPYWIIVFLISAFLNYSYDDRQPFSSLLIVWNKHSLKYLIVGKFTNLACKFFLIVCFSRHFDVHFNFHAGRCCFGAPWKHNFICECQVTWFSNPTYHIICYMFLLHVLLVCRVMFIFLIKSYLLKKKKIKFSSQTSI